MVGKYLIEQIAGMPAEVDLASEFRYRNPILDESCVVIPVSQSGETADTLAALRKGKESGSRVISICNVRDATIARESDDVLYTHAGPEIGVASTKAFTTQIVALYLLALKLGIARGRVGADEARARIGDLMRLPRLVEQVIHLDEPDPGHRAEVLPRDGFPLPRPRHHVSRSPSRARSSSRRSPTSTPRATRPAR